MEWACALSTVPDLAEAIDEVADSVRDQLGGGPPDLTVVFASPLFGRGLARAPAELTARLGGGALIGCAGGGIIGDGREVEGAPAVAVVAARMPGVDVVSFHLGADPGGWAERLPPAGAPHHFIVLPDPFTCDAGLLVRWLDGRYPHGVKVGGLASGAGQPGGNALFCGERAHTGGVVGVALTGDLVIDTVVAQGCRPIGTPMFITRCERNAVLEIDGRPAIEVVQDVYDTLDERDRQLFRGSLFLGCVMRDAQQAYGHGDFLVRNILGVDPDRGALIVGMLPRDNQVVQFHLRDARTSADDLHALLAEQRRASGDLPPAGALLFSCLGRGTGLYGEPDHDSQLIRTQLGELPIAGFFCNGEIGPVGGQTFLHGYTSSIALFRARGPLA